MSEDLRRTTEEEALDSLLYLFSNYDTMADVDRFLAECGDALDFMLKRLHLILKTAKEDAHKPDTKRRCHYSPELLAVAIDRCIQEKLSDR